MTRLAALTLALTALAPIAACDSDEGAAAPLQNVTLQVAGRFDGADVICDQGYTGVGASASRIEITDFRFYLHDVRLIAADGAEVSVALEQDGVWQHDDVALIDLEDKTGACSNGTAETRATIVGQVPQGDYAGLSFRLGVPEALNHADVATAPSPLNLSTMFWSWTSGYKFLRLDIKSTGQPTGYNVHLGSTACDGTPATAIICDNANRPAVTFASFDPATDAIVFDVGALFADANVDANSPPSSGCMSGIDDPDCGAIFASLGLSHGGAPAPAQTVFTVGGR